MSLRPMHRVSRARAALLASLLTLLGACASAPGIPETTWHRLPAASASVPLTDTSELPIVVQQLEADGLHADQALLYALDASGQRLRAYHYNLWVDPPGYLLQRRTIARLRAAGASARVTDQLSSREPALWVSGRIERFERVPRAGGGYEAQVGLRLRVARHDGGEPLVEREYAATVAASDDRLATSVQALGAATDQALDAFLIDLGRALAEATP
ncbi:MAG: membrane integrity-associated transporter subunit PqiC [Xanthomonadales bacterium]|nr:membrane integrity-associated transporter subunit PqiC [Xanthomonadales bacterium]